MGRLMLVLFLIAGLVILDQASKAAVRGRFLLGEGIALVPGLFDLHYVQNTGAAWGMFSGFNGALVTLSFVMLVLVFLFRHHFMTGSTVCRVAVGLMVAGILGNLIDRIRLGYVVDFLDFHWNGHHFPAFNVADMAICTGVGLYILAQLAAERRARREAPPTPDPMPEGATD